MLIVELPSNNNWLCFQLPSLFDTSRHDFRTYYYYYINEKYLETVRPLFVCYFYFDRSPLETVETILYLTIFDNFCYL